MLSFCVNLRNVGKDVHYLILVKKLMNLEYDFFWHAKIGIFVVHQKILSLLKVFFMHACYHDHAVCRSSFYHSFSTQDEFQGLDLSMFL